MSKHERLAAPPKGPHAVEDLGEGYNPAMWTVTVLGILSAAIGTWAVISLSAILGIIAVVIAVLAVIAGVVLTKMGMGTYSLDEHGDSPEGKESLGIR